MNWSNLNWSNLKRDFENNCKGNITMNTITDNKETYVTSITCNNVSYFANPSGLANLLFDKKFYNIDNLKQICKDIRVGSNGGEYDSSEKLCNVQCNCTNVTLSPVSLKFSIKPNFSKDYYMSLIKSTCPKDPYTCR